jgi:xylulokinase
MSSRPTSVVFGIDIGTSAVKCLAVAEGGTIVAQARRPHPIESPRDGWLQQDPLDWWQGACHTVRDCISKLPAGTSVAAVAVTGHMSALTLFDEQLQPLHPAILIADTRSRGDAHALREKWGASFLATTGNHPSDAFTVAKLKWAQRELPEAFQRARCFLFPKDFVRYHLTGDIHTDPTDAANTLLLDLGNRQWNQPLIRELDLPFHLFPSLSPSTVIAGPVTPKAASETGLPQGIPVVTGAADMACSFLGSGAGRPETTAITLSTSCQIVAAVGGITPAAMGKITFHPQVTPGRMFALGSVFSGGLGFDWAGRVLQGEETSTEAKRQLEREAQAVEAGSGGVLFIPFLTGSGTPYFRPGDRAAWLGLSPGSTRPALFRAAIEGICFNIRQNVEALEEAGVETKCIALGGGGSHNPLWRQILADVLARSVQPLSHPDAAPMGACALAAAGAGWGSAEILSDQWTCTDAPVDPRPESSRIYGSLYSAFQQAAQLLQAL